MVTKAKVYILLCISGNTKMKSYTPNLNKPSPLQREERQAIEDMVVELAAKLESEEEKYFVVWPNQSQRPALTENLRKDYFYILARKKDAPDERMDERRLVFGVRGETHLGIGSKILDVYVADKDATETILGHVVTFAKEQGIGEVTLKESIPA